MKVVVFGCGYVGVQTARLFVEAGSEVIGVTRSAESADQLARERFPVVARDITDRAALASEARFARPDVVISAVSSGGGNADDYRRLHLQGMQNILEVLQPTRAVFVSSTSVYAQVDGSSVDEWSPAEPDRETGKILRQTEELVLGQGGDVARLAGIYGPGRSILLRKFFDGAAVVEGDGGHWINQIHRDDAARALLFLAQTAPPGIFNVCDDTPLPQIVCYRWLAEKFQSPLPPSGPIDFQRKRAWTNKRVSNAKLRALGWQPRFPSFKDAVENDPELVVQARG
ncbi:MAG: shikimate kinase / 3-dehydroquinate synthase [Chthoniobacter sp.]|jgi:nucleoside-diphosphate-sugar epimerase|nr:shikimate kinase / 3-dehydroquinate synthase [Chthoniobacter sp.]